MTRTPWLIIVIAFIFYSPLFIFNQIGPLDFWDGMALIVMALLIVIVLRDRLWLPWLVSNIKSRFWMMTLLGIISAIVLYGVFFIGNWVSRLLFNFASYNIESVYSLKEGAANARIALYITLLIGPAEELIWRAYIQEKFSAYRSPLLVLSLTTLFYVGIHWGSLNVMLLLAALVCGVFWGILYIKYRSVWLNIVSHTIWDLAVFIFFPFS